MDRNLQRTGLINWLALLVLGGLLAYEAPVAGSATGAVSVAFVAIGFLVALVSWLQMRLATREELEKAEMEDLARSRRQSSIFDETANETFPARRSRLQFEKWVIPGFTFVLFAVQAGAAFWLWRDLRGRGHSVGDAAVLAMALFAGMGLALFILGRYGARLAQLESSRLLRPGSASVMLAAFLCFITAGTEAAQWFGLQRVDLYTAWGLVGLLGLISVETLFALVFEAFRPRVKGRETRLIYESRLIGLLGQPTGIFSTAAHALDYQFGFKVSDTWFYKFIEDRLGRYIAYWALMLLGSTCLVSIQPSEEALIERFGSPAGSRALLAPGLHLKFPWPVERVQRFNSREIHSLNVGFTPDVAGEKERALLWTRSHYREEVNFLVASREQGATNGIGSEQTVPVNFLVASIPVQFIISDVRAWAYNHNDPAKMLEHIANREVVRYFSSVDVENVMSNGRMEAAASLTSRIQAAADAVKLGVQIVFVGLQDVHPPVGNKEIQVAAAYEKVIGAEQDKAAAILSAEGNAFAMLPTSQAERARIVNEAKGAAETRMQDAAGRATLFDSQLKAYRAAPGVFSSRNYYNILARSLGPARKIVILATNTHDVVIYDLSERVRADLLSGAVLENPNKEDKK